MKSKAKNLFILWIISFFAVDCAVGYWVVYQRTAFGINPVDIFSELHIAIICCLMFYFIPLISLVNRTAKQTGKKVIYSISRVIFLILSLWTVLSLLLGLLKLIHSL